jgi:hypothetical protein
MSNIGDVWAEKFPDKWPHFNPPPTYIPIQIPNWEIEALRKEVAELRKLLKAAKEFDSATGQPDCEMEQKVKLIKDIARLVGVNMEDVFR